MTYKERVVKNERTEDMEIREYVRALRKRWWWVATALAVALALAGALNLTMTPRYSSSVTFFVNVPSRGVADAYTGGLFSTERVTSYVEVLTSDRLAQAIASDKTLGLDAAQVRSRITAHAVPDSVVLQATVIDTSPDRSLQIARSLTTTFVAFVQTLEAAPGGGPPAVHVEVVSGPELNPTPISPQPTRNLLLGALLGLLVGAAIVALRHMLDSSVQSPDALQRFEIGPHLGSVRNDPAMSNQPLVGDVNDRSWRAEELRRLRTNLSFAKLDKNLHIMAVTSALPGEGASSTAANLAIVVAESGLRVAIVDANLRNPRLAEIFDVKNAMGLTEVLGGRASLESALQPWGAHHLCVLPSGTNPSNPSELLGSPAMEVLLRDLKDRFDIVIIDTPPLVPIADAAVVAAQADGTILVVRHGKTSVGQVRTAVQALHTVEARIIGYVLTRVPPLKRSHRKQYDRSGYGDVQPRKRPAPIQLAEPLTAQVHGASVTHLEVAATLADNDGAHR